MRCSRRPSIYRAISFRELYGAILTSAKATTSVGILIGGALVFNYVVTIENIPQSLRLFMNGSIFPGGIPPAGEHRPPDPRLPA